MRKEEQFLHGALLTEFLRPSHPGCIAGAAQGRPSVLAPFDSPRSIGRV